jgi:hypothetical protein
MHLYIHNARPGVDLPCSVEEIEPLLSREIALVAKHFVCNQLSFFSQVRISGIVWNMIGTGCLGR